MIRVVIADGNRAIRYGIRAALRTEPDIELVGEVENGNAALRVAQELRPDVLVLDLWMPVLRGLAVIRTLAPLLPDVRIVVYSLAAGFQADALAAGAAVYVSKSAPEEVLLREIRHVARASSPARSSAATSGRLGEYLLLRRLITPAQLGAALAWQRELLGRGHWRKLGELLVDLGAIHGADLLRAVRRRDREARLRSDREAYGKVT